MDLLGQKNATVLVVDDEKSLLHLIEAVLVQEGFDVLAAASAEDALRIVRSHDGNIDLLLTDMCLPGMQGTTLGKEFGRSHPDSGIVYMTACSLQEIDRLLEGETVMQKPFHIDRLCDTLNGFLCVGS